MEEMPAIHTSVSTSLKRRTLMRGTALASVGVLIILFSGIFLRPEILGHWGFLLFLIGFFLIAQGLIPYRRLCRLELNPEKLIVSSDETIHYFQKGHEILAIPKHAIEKIRFVEESNLPYGIAFDLKWPEMEGLRSLNPSFNLAKRRERSLKFVGSDLFLPYFSKRAYTQLLELL